MCQCYNRNSPRFNPWSIVLSRPYWCFIERSLLACSKSAAELHLAVSVSYFISSVQFDIEFYKTDTTLYHQNCPLNAHWQIYRKGVLKSIVQVMKHVNFQLYRANPDGVIWEMLTNDDKYINKQVWLFIHQTMFVSGVEKNKLLWRYEFHTSAKWLFNYFQKSVHKEKLKVVDKEF